MKNIDYAFEINKDALICKKKVEVFIPKFYEDRGLYTVSAVIETLGILEVKVDGISQVLCMFNTIEMDPSSIDVVTKYEEDYYKLNFEVGDRFLSNRFIIRNPIMADRVYTAFLGLGKLPGFFTYDNVHLLFDKVTETSSANIPILRCIFEVVYSRIFRDRQDPFKLFRHTDMSKDPRIVPLHKISHGPESASARMIGSYDKEGRVSSLINDNTTEADIENLTRA